jgi:two-component system, chemotaxis family, protein-glutamate methylesterase/glutaminase
MKKIRVLIVDDSTVIRRLLSDSLAADPAIEVAGTAANGKIALAKMPQVNPDIITLDMEMPEMDGLTTLVELRKLYPKLPIIMFSTLTQRGAEATLDALARGATDYVTKPANVGSVTAAIQNVQNELLPKIKMFCGHRAATTQTPRSLAPVNRLASLQPQIPRAHTKPHTTEVVVIGTSTGGPNALAAVIPKIPADFPVPILIVQHMPPIFTTHLAARLNQLSPLSVAEAADGDVLAPGTIWLAPGNFHMTLRRAGTQIKISLNQNIPENSCRPAVDVLFRSAAQVYGPNVLSVVMTGMGQDGQRGCEVIREAGGKVLAQDEMSSVVWGMPGSVVHSGLADQVLPLNRIADEIIQQTKTGKVQRSLTKVGV